MHRLHSGVVLSHEEERNGGHRNMGATRAHLKQKKPEWQILPAFPSPPWILCVYTCDMKGVWTAGRTTRKGREEKGEGWG